MVKFKFAKQHIYITTHIQLYLADVLSKAVRTKLERSTGNKFEKINKVDFSVGDALQILIILNGIGHFNTTFVGSKAMIDACHKNELFMKNCITCFQNEKNRELAQKLIAENMYLHFHMLNALLILEKLENIPQVEFSIKLLHCYLGGNCFIDNEEKLSMFIILVMSMPPLRLSRKAL